MKDPQFSTRLSKLYINPIPITKANDDLVTCKNKVIPSEYRQFYRKLPFTRSEGRRDDADDQDDDDKNENEDD